MRLSSSEPVEGRSIGSSSIFEISEQKTTAFVDNIRYRWASKSDFWTSTMACIFSVDVFDTFIQINNNNPGVYHFAIIMAFVGLPAYYMQLLLGQYSQMGTIVIKYLSPIAHGVAVLFIVNLILRTIRQSLLLDDAVVYFVTSMQSQLQWSICPPNPVVPCYELTLNCTNLICHPGTANETEYRLPAYIFYKYHYLKNPELDPDKMKLAFPNYGMMAVHCIVWFFICVILICTSNYYIKAIKVIRLITLTLMCFLLPVVTFPHMSESMAYLFAVRVKSLVSVSAWVSGIFDTIQILALARSFHVVHGSFLGMNEQCSIYAFLMVIIHFSLTLFCNLFTTTCLINVADKTNVDKNHLHRIFKRGRENFQILIPQWLSTKSIPQLYNCVYFAILITINVSQQITHLTFIQMSLNDMYLGLQRYKNYSMILLSLICALIGFFLRAPESYLIFYVMVRLLPDDAAIFNVFLLCVAVCWIYGVQRFSDDIYFFTGQPPKRYWRMCWYLLPFILMGAFLHQQISYGYDVSPKIKPFHITLLLIFISPVPIIAIFEMFRFIKARNLIGLFQPQERFGPPDPTERELRRMFNPRTETKSRRRVQVCKHRCLLGSKPLKNFNAAYVINEPVTRDYQDTRIFDENLD